MPWDYVLTPAGCAELDVAGMSDLTHAANSAHYAASGLCRSEPCTPHWMSQRGTSVMYEFESTNHRGRCRRGFPCDRSRSPVRLRQTRHRSRRRLRPHLRLESVGRTAAPDAWIQIANRGQRTDRRLYFDQQGGLTNRVVEGSAIRASENGCPFPVSPPASWILTSSPGGDPHSATV